MRLEMAVLFRRRRRLRYLLASCFFSQIGETTEEKEIEKEKKEREIQILMKWNEEIRVLPKKETEIWAC